MRGTALAVGVLLGALSIACGRYGPPIRTEREPARAAAAAYFIYCEHLANLSSKLFRLRYRDVSNRY